jgi:hypothetical protein
MPREAQNVESLKLRQAIEAFEQRAPKNLPDGLLDKLGEVKDGLSTTDSTQAGQSPGQREVGQSQGQGTDGTGAPYPVAARGPDQPSPGQREAMSVSAEIEKAAAGIAEKVKSGERDRTSQAA